MISILLTFLTAIMISAVAGYYSVVGLVTIFSAATIPVILMGGSLEIAKLVTASWVYRNWTIAPKALKYYLTAAVVVLSLITSMGIFGFLSSAHIQQASQNSGNSIKIQNIDTQIKLEQSRIDNLIKQQEKYATPPAAMQKQIKASQDNLTRLNTEKLPLLEQQNRLTAEIGPVIYIAEMIYGDREHIDNAVRFVIMLLILVFDPLAILLLIAANFSLKNKDVDPATGFVRIDPSKVMEM